jgi:hypothetical protein
MTRSGATTDNYAKGCGPDYYTHLPQRWNKAETGDNLIGIANAMKTLPCDRRYAGLVYLY